LNERRKDGNKCLKKRKEGRVGWKDLGKIEEEGERKCCVIRFRNRQTSEQEGRVKDG